VGKGMQVVARLGDIMCFMFSPAGFRLPGQVSAGCPPHFPFAFSSAWGVLHGRLDALPSHTGTHTE